MKIIQLSKRGYDNWNNNNHSKDLDNINFIEDGWHFTMANYLKIYNKDLNIECWRVDEEVRNPTVKKSKGIKVKLIPDSKNDFFQISLIKELFLESQRNKIILHIHMAHDIQTYVIVNLFSKVFPIIVQHRGNWHRIIANRNKTGFRYWFMAKLESSALKKVSKFYTCSKYWKVITQKFNNKISMQSGGKDFKNFNVIDKNKCRQKWQIPKSSIVLLYIGKCVKLKGLDLIIRSFEKLKEKYNLHLLIVGGSSKDELFPEVEDLSPESSTHINYIDYKEIPEIINSSDIYLNYLRGNDKFFAGISSSLVEALACEKPALSRNLIHFPGNYKELGLIPKDENDFVNKLENLIKDRSKYINLRQIVKPYYSWENQTKVIMTDYKKLYSQYFS